MSCTNSEVMLTTKVGAVTVTLSRVWLVWNERDNCSFQIKRSDEQTVSVCYFEGEAVSLFHQIVSELKEIKESSMARKTVNISSNEIYEQLNLQLTNGWEANSDSEIDTLCINGRDFNLGYIVQLVMDSYKGYSFIVYEFVERKEDGETNESDNDFLTYDEALNFIRTKVEAYSA